jgi:hypothetical protein
VLRADIELDLAFMRGHRNHLVAFLEIFLNARDDDGRPLMGGEAA